MYQPGQNCNDLEQYSHRECVEISGIPPSVWKEENLTEVVSKIGELTGVKMTFRFAIDFPIAGSKMTGINSNGSANRIFLAESLTEQNKDLF